MNREPYIGFTYFPDPRLESRAFEHDAGRQRNEMDRQGQRGDLSRQGHERSAHKSADAGDCQGLFDARDPCPRAGAAYEQGLTSEAEGLGRGLVEVTRSFFPSLCQVPEKVCRGEHKNARTLRS